MQRGSSRRRRPSRPCPRDSHSDSHCVWHLRMRIAREPGELGHGPRAVALGTFDGVHLGHRRVIETLLGAGPEPTVVTFDPHPRTALGNRVDLLMSLERRLELLAGLGVDAALVVEFTLDVARLEPQAFADEFLRPIGAETVVAGENFRFGRARQGDLTLLESLGFANRPARLLGRPVEVEGIVVTGDARGGTLGFPTANLDVRPELLVPQNGIYAGAAGENRAAVSIGTNPHYGGSERRVEAFLLDFEGDLYGERLIVELWRRLREERAFASEDELVAQITRDVEATRAAERPV